MDLSDQQLLRYSRQIMLPQVDVAGQERLLHATVLVIGVGGLGSPVALYLAASGVGRLILSDPDVVDLTNLQRQIAHATDTVGTLKVTSAAGRLQQINPEVVVESIPAVLEGDDLLAQVQRADVVVDCTDNLASRFAINRACVQAKKPLVSAAAIRWEGQISVYQPAHANSPCYQCFYGNVNNIPQTCSQNGVIGPLLGILGSMQAVETLKLLVGVGEPLMGRVLLLDALNMEWTEIRLPKRPDCLVCGQVAETKK